MRSFDTAIRGVANPVLAALHLKGRRSRHVFASDAPNTQATVDIFANQWITAVPPELGVVAGSVNHFDPEVDPRVSWVESLLPDGLSGMSVLELGPFEAYQTALLEQAGANPVLAVEGSETAFLKCLIVKELLGLNARFLYGDVQKFLAESDDRYDIIWASGILYHQSDPIGLLERIAEHADRVFLHTHFYDPATPLPSIVADRMNPKGDVHAPWHGSVLHLHRYEYVDATFTNRFAGGPQQHAMWMELADIEYVLTTVGLSDITYGVLDPKNPQGPAMFLLACRPGHSESAERIHC